MVDFRSATDYGPYSIYRNGVSEANVVTIYNYMVCNLLLNDNQTKTPRRHVCKHCFLVKKTQKNSFSSPSHIVNRYVSMDIYNQQTPFMPSLEGTNGYNSDYGAPIDTYHDGLTQEMAFPSAGAPYIDSGASQQSNDAPLTQKHGASQQSNDAPLTQKHISSQQSNKDDIEQNQSITGSVENGHNKSTIESMDIEENDKKINIENQNVDHESIINNSGIQQPNTETQSIQNENAETVEKEVRSMLLSIQKYMYIK